MKRRAFFGLMGGAAVAGPSIAKTAIAELPAGLGANINMPSMGSYGTVGESSVGGPDKSWRMKEIANLRRIISGDMNDEEKEERRRHRLYQQDRIISQSVASLVSVSGVRKLDMYRDRMERHQDKIRISETKSRLHWLLRDDT